MGSDLTLKLGFRYDEYDNSDEIPFNPFFQDRNGFSNQKNLDGKDLFLPRFGFNWAANDKLTVRGGAGLFVGGSPLITLGNSYAGNGITRAFASFLAPFFGPPISDALAAAVAALPDPTAAFTHLQPFIGVNPVGDVDAIHPDFEILSTWKYKLGADWLFGKDWLLSADVIFSDVKNGYDIYEGRRVQVATAPDGRPIYDIPAGGDYIVTNTGEGESTVITLSLDKSFIDTRSGRWDLNLGYTNQDVEELRSYNRFVGFETYAFDPQTDLNNGQVAPSRFEVGDRITGTVRWQNQIFGDNTTSIGLTYQGRSGRHFSYVFGSGGVPTFGGTFLADFGSEGDGAAALLRADRRQRPDHHRRFGVPRRSRPVHRGRALLERPSRLDRAAQQLRDRLGRHLQHPPAAGDPGVGGHRLRRLPRHRELRQPDQQRLGPGR